MEIKPVHEFLGELKITQLALLHPSRKSYRAALFQPSGPVEASSTRIGHENSSNFIYQCRAFLEKSVDSYADLVVTPEYSLPWKLFDEIAGKNSSLQPTVGAIWVLGFESIKPAEFEQFVNRARGNNNFVHHEPFDPAELINKTYVDPLVYVFWSDLKTDAKQLCFVIQFKTAPCREALDTEYTNLYTGNVVYKISNCSQPSISLLTILCSDSFDFDTVNQHTDKCLLIHIQLNPKPAHRPYATYRDTLYAVGGAHNVELLCLNWASQIREIKGANKYLDWKNNSGSAWFAPQERFNAAPQHIDAVHRNGLYYSVPKSKWHAAFLHCDAHALFISKEKVHFGDGTYAEEPKVWIQVKGRWIWDQFNREFFAELQPDSMFDKAVSDLPMLKVAIKDLLERSAVDAERSLELLCGPKQKESGVWFNIDQLESMRMIADESSCRATVSQDFEPDSKGAEFRDARLLKGEDAVQLTGKNLSWPYPVQDLVSGFKYAWNKKFSFQNIRCNSTSKPATLVYLGHIKTRDVAANTYSWLEKEIHIRCAEAQIYDYEELTKFKERVCIVYYLNHNLEILDRPNSVSITTVNSGNAASIMEDPL